MMKRQIAFFLLACSFAAAFLTGCAEKEQASGTSFHMDTFVSLRAYGDGARALIDACEKRLTELEKCLSATIEGSDVSRLNSANGEWISLGDDAFCVLKASLEAAELTDGAFDLTVAAAMKAWDGMSGETLPSEYELEKIRPLVDFREVELDEERKMAHLGAGQSIDFGAIAKGYAADELNALYNEYGCTGIIDLGGSIYAVGAREGSEPWRIAVQDPRGDGYKETLELVSCAAVTSGDYQRFFERDGVRYHHIIDPKTLCPARSGIASVTVIGKNSMLADAYATAMFVMGAEKAVEFAEKNGVCALIIEDDGTEIWVNG